jgi:hypothetical protein
MLCAGSINYQQHDLGVMDRDAVRLLLIGRARGHKGIGSCYFYVRGKFYASLDYGTKIQGVQAARD